MSRQIPWARVTAEGVIIVVSILLAFGIDAWWDGIQEREEEREILLGLRRDFAEIEEDLVTRAARAEEITEDTEFLLSLAGTSPARIPLAQVDTAMRRFVQAPTYEPGEATLDALLGSGRLDLIESRALRESLSEWRYVLDETTDDEVVVRDFIRETLVPYLAKEEVPLIRAYAMPGAALPYPPLAEMPSVPDGVAAQTYARVLSDVEFRSLAAYRHAWIRSSAIQLREALTHVRHMLSLLEHEIGSP